MLSKVQLLQGQTDWDLSDEDITEYYYRLEAVELRGESVEVVDVEVDMGDAQSSYYKVKIVATGQIIDSLNAMHLVDTDELEAFYQAFKG